ncbi:MAG: inositol monophosphatase family protein [Parvularcula sp.]|nr:inositol monophosphatase family protein [Parvularcula sp.]
MTNELISFAQRLADSAAAETLPRFRQSISILNKKDGGFDPVTEADKEAERVMRELIEERDARDGVFGEEWPERPSQNGRRWVLDPVDGTRAFICGVPVWTTLIALEDERPFLGVIDQPFLGERWVGLVGETTVFSPPKGLQGPSGCTRLSEARLMVTDLRAGEYFTDEEAESVARVAARARLCRRGLDSYGFGLVASGQMDLVVEAGLRWFDIAAVLPVIEAAGGTAITWGGEPVRPKANGTLDVIIAATPALAEETARLLTA